MTVAERVAERLTNAPFEETIRERSVADAARALGRSKPEIYRLVASGVLGHLKVDGAARRGRGQAGRVSFLLEHLVAFQVMNEVTPGAAAKPKARRAGGAA